MEVEYEQPPEHAEQRHEEESHHSDGEGAEGVEPAAGGEGEAPKKKRVIKSRQSLAEKQPGTTIFPMARLKKIVKADKDLDMMTTEAVFLVGVATEYFIKHFMEEGYTKARLEKRRIVNYRDMANVVARSDEFGFLSDVIPQPMSMSEALELKKKKMSEAPGSGAESSEEEEEDSEDEDGEPKEKGPVNKGHGELPPLTSSTNPAFPNAIMKKPSNTHARHAMPKPGDEEKEKDAEKEKEKESQRVKPTSPKVPLSGKNAPSTPTGLTTRSRRSLAAESEPEPREDEEDDDEVDEKMAVDE
ncbi:hypothetical protein A1Q2_01001 [Trichosporon asahii var. asahii CBS 8904]|uniref:Transcription factor CBF/NF-Y/archaeal histone domain-containing protein n=2 Tax=Trichosporon asahii var. asahii TaxID=189963 RepID=K1VW21_TRIAC|nr:hypothetical protein A1Q1_05946 [Trichosporon asahii var. asahii CBS 2479]EJT45609.1 hypothetical protein A1Q1_05946 [Trichosporon asahii var. asahii CBS 2479]EKD04771.1 hypothetical protein A1Q2_01001 [Trichosporon asahii var. asahii CBS 8904]